MKIKALLSAVLALLAANLGVFAADVVGATEVSAALKRGAILWDVRSADDYAKGHIPGARNIPFEQNRVDPDTAVKLAKGEVKTRDGMAFKSPAQLRALYAGLDPRKETIVYCQSGGRAALTASVLRDLGFSKVRVFEESWLGYGNTLSAPAEDVQFVNIGALMSRITSLEREVENLTAEVKALEGAKR